MKGIKIEDISEVIDYAECSHCGATMPIHKKGNLYEANCFSPGCPNWRVLAGNIAVLKGELVDLTPKHTVVIKDPIKPWSPCLGENCHCKSQNKREA